MTTGRINQVTTHTHKCVAHSQAETSKRADTGRETGALPNTGKPPVSLVNAYTSHFAHGARLQRTLLPFSRTAKVRERERRSTPDKHFSV